MAEAVDIKPAESPQASPTVKFAIGTFVALKAAEYIADTVKTHATRHVKSLAVKHKHLLTKKRVIVLGLGVVGLGAYLYYQHKKNLLIAAQAAADAAAVNQTPSPQEVIASAIPDVQLSVWG
jgi:hypothetical protein